jgi:PAS domain S-box-containing protein
VVGLLRQPQNVLEDIMDPSEPSRISILLVEDNDHDCFVFHQALKRSGVNCEITECDRAEQALERLHPDASSFDLVVIDYVLPGMSGLDLCKALWEKRIELPPLVILTGKGSEELAVEALKGGVVDYLVKDASEGYLELLPVVLTQAVRRHEDRIARRRAEAALRASEERYRTVLEVCPVPIAVYDIEGKATYVNQAFTRIFGWSREEVVGKEIDYVPAENRPETSRIIDKVLAGEIYAGGSSRRFTKDGDILDVSLSVAVHPNHEGVPAGTIHILRDITERKQAEEALQRARDELERRVEERTSKLAITAQQLKMEIAERKRSQEQLEQYAAELERSNKALEKFAYVASHDLQEPLRTVTTYIRMLQRICMGRAGSDAEEYIAYAVDGANRMARLIDNLLSYSRVRTEKPAEPSD